MGDRAIVNAVQGSPTWGVHTAPAVFTKYVRAIKLTVAGTGTTALTVVNAEGAAVSTGELAVGVLEPMVGIKEVTALGAGVTEYRVYY